MENPIILKSLSDDSQTTFDVANLNVICVYREDTYLQVVTNSRYAYLETREGNAADPGGIYEQLKEGVSKAARSERNAGAESIMTTIEVY